MPEVLYQVINSKVIDYAEVVLVFFEHCNLNCVFCPQDHDSYTGATREEILKKGDGAIEWMNNNTRSKYFKMHLMGGELFEDQFIDDGFLDMYAEFMEKVSAEVTSDKHVAFNFITNLTFNQIDRVIEFCEKYDLKMSVSYDPAGRFTPKQKELFEQNIWKFQPYVEMISIVLTEQNMRTAMAGDRLFDELYKNFACDWDHYIPAIQSISPHLTPPDSLMLEFYKFLVDKYPKCLNVQPFTHPEPHNKMRCTRGNSYTVLADNSKPYGCSGSVMLKDAMTERNESAVILESFFDKHNCFECEYFAQCPFTCFINNDYRRTVRDIEGCVFKETFDYVNSK